MSDDLRLSRRTPFSFEITGGAPRDLARWLEACGYDRVTLHNSIIEAHRLESPLQSGQRAVITIFRSGVVVCMGHEAPCADAIALLRGLVVDQEPEGEQLALFAEVA